VLGDVVSELLRLGVTVAQLIADTIANPGKALENLLKAVEAAGKSLKTIVEAAIIQPTEEAARRVFAALKELGKSAVDILKGALEIGGSAIALAFTLILEWFPGSYRELTPDERTDAENVFGTSIALDKVRVAVMAPAVDLIE